MHAIKTVFRSRSRRGGVAVMALILAVVMLLMFQAYITNVISDNGVGESLDRYTQYQGERVALERIVKEAVLEHYELIRMGKASPGVTSLLNSFLSSMAGSSGVTYTASTVPDLPGNSIGSFWPLIRGNPQSLGGSYNLFDVPMGNVTSKRKVGQYAPNPASVYAVAGAASTDDVFEFVIDRTGDGNTVRFNLYTRLYQVPASDYNLISYAIATSPANIPASPPAITSAMSAALANGSLHGLAMTQMGGGNAISSAVDFPYSYRELFSAASLLWEWVFYDDDYIRTLFPNKNWVFTRMDMSAYDIPSPGLEGFYCVANTDSDGNVTDGVWNIDLHYLPDPNIMGYYGGGTEPEHDTFLDGFRRIYIQLPDNPASVNSSLVIRDSVVTGAASAATDYNQPVIIWINGWEAAQQSTLPGKYQVYLTGNLTDQPLYIFASGVDITASTNTTMNGMILLDDRLGGLAAASGATLTVNGLVAWNGMNEAAVDMNGSIAIGSFASNPFRTSAPRYLLVDVQSRVTINP